MNKQAVVDKLVEQGYTKKDATAALDSVIGAIEDVTIEHGKLVLIGHGTYEVRERGARKGRNPQTGEEIQIAASKTIAYKPGKAVKDRLNS